MEFILKGKIERGGKNIDLKNAVFSVTEQNTSTIGDKEKSTLIELKDLDVSVGTATIEECNNEDLKKDYVQLRVIMVDPKYQGGNAVSMLYEKSIEYAESLNKKLLFDSSLTESAYKSFKKLENLGYKVIENPEAKFDGSHYRAEKSWVLRVERKNN